MELQQRINGTWHAHWVFILAATGSAVGLGNIWKFPYIAGENGGAAFVLVYVVCITLIGIPIMVAETMLGRRGRMSPVNTMLQLAKESGASRWWSGIGWSGMLAGVFILSFYSVVAGWSLHYIFLAFGGQFIQVSAEASGNLFSSLLADVETLVLWHTVFMIMTVVIVMAGVVKGLGRAISIIMPLLFALLLVMLVYSASVGNFSAGWSFLFGFNPSDVEWKSIHSALGHAFFTLSLGMGAIMAYGAYMPDTGPDKKPMSLGKVVLSIAALDTLVALVAGLVIFPIVFAHPALEPGAGPGLLFVSLPIAFGSMFAGQFFAVLFFILIALAALSSAISILEPIVAWMVESKKLDRRKASILFGSIIWFVGLGTVLSFNHWAEIKLFGKTFFDTLDFLTANIMLPLGGLCIALFVGWCMKEKYIVQELGFIEDGPYKYWLRVLRYVTPLLVIWVFVKSLIGD